MTRRAILALVAIALGVAGAVVAPVRARATAPAPRVTVVADSVGGALVWMGDARAILSRGIDLELEIATCRKLVDAGCAYQGGRPSSALDAIRTRETSLGRVVVVNVGYNDVAAGYGDGIDRVMRALQARQVERVVWVTLREQRPSYPAINDAIRAAARRWPGLVVADWNAVSEAHDEWFSDGVHMSVEGGEVYARFLRPLVLEACGASCGPNGDLLAVGTTKLVGARVGTPFAGRLQARGGTAPYRWKVMGLPRPLRVTGAGAVIGRPRSSGRFRLVVDVTDADGITNEGIVLLKVAPRG